MPVLPRVGCFLARKLRFPGATERYRALRPILHRPSPCRTHIETPGRLAGHSGADDHFETWLVESEGGSELCFRQDLNGGPHAALAAPTRAPVAAGGHVLT